MHQRALCGKDKKNRLRRKEDRGTLPGIRASHLANMYLESTGIKVEPLLAAPLPFQRRQADSPSDSQELKELHGRQWGSGRAVGALTGFGAGEEARTVLQGRLRSQSWHVEILMDNCN